MTKSTPSQLDRSRPSSRLQAQTMLETTPVLFRLPSVQLQPLPPVADMPTESLMEFAVAPMPEANPAPATLPVSITSQPMEADEPPRTWWEHWSSGVILILLLVAAYFACIAVLRSRGHAGSNTIATDSSSKSEFGDLADMKIAPLSNATGSNATSSNATSGNATENQLNQPTALTANDSSAADALVNSLVSPPGSNSFSNGNSNSLTLENPAKELSQPLATAQLLEPLQMPNNSLQLLNDRDVSNSNGVQAQSASMQLGQSPSLYDGASNSGGGLSPLAEPSLPPFTPASLNPNSFALDTNAPSLTPALNNPTLNNPTLNNPSLNGPAVSNTAATGSTTYGQAYPASPTIPNLVASSANPSGTNPVAPSLGVNASTVSTQQLPAGQGTPSNVRTTVTPEANGEVESIIKAYVDLMRAGQASQSANTQNAPANRYQPVR